MTPPPSSHRLNKYIKILLFAQLITSEIQINGFIFTRGNTADVHTLRKKSEYSVSYIHPYIEKYMK